jgi:hypothetical protein
MDKYRQIKENCRENLAFAREMLTSSHEEFKLVLDSIASGIPLPDEDLWIKQACANHSLCIDALETAAARLQDFLVHAKVPNHIKWFE